METASVGLAPDPVTDLSDRDRLAGMLPFAAKAVFADIGPEGGADIDAARVEDRKRVARMLASDPADWPDSDIDLVAFRSVTTLGGPETLKWILPHFLERSATRIDHGWLVGSDMLGDKLDSAGFNGWPSEQRMAVLAMLHAWLAIRPPDEDDTELRAWLGRHS